MKCTVHDLEVMGSNPSLVELGVHSTKSYLYQKYQLPVHQYLKAHACSPQIIMDNVAVHAIEVPDDSVVKMRISGTLMYCQ